MKIGFIVPDDYAEMGGGFSYKQTFINYLIRNNLKIGLHEFIPVFIYKRTIETELYKFEKKLDLINSFGRFFHRSRNLLLQNNFDFYFPIFIKLLEKLYTKFYYKNLENIDMFYYFNGQDILTYKIPYFYNIWDLGHLFINSFPEISSNIERRFNAEIDAKRASYILTESNTGRNDVSFSYNINLNKIGVLPMYGNIYKNRIDAPDFENMLNEKSYLKNNYLFYPAQFWPHKNHYNLLLALNKLKNEGKDIKIVFTGSDKGNLSYIKNLLIELGLQNNVLFLGFITDDDIQYLYRNSFALIMPTYLGPTNMPIIEAMQNNCLVLCSNLDGHIEQTNGQAIYFDPHNYNDIANKIQLAYTNVNGKNAEIVKNAYLYSLNINIENTCDKLNEYLNNFQSTRFCWPNSMRN